MRTVLRCLTPLAAATALLAVTGCSSIPVQTWQNADTPNYPPTNPTTVQILRQAPTQPNITLGQITVVPQLTSIPVSETEARLRQAGAKLGAHAVVIVVETTFTEAMAARGWWKGQVSPDIGQVFVGVPIRYTGQKVAQGNVEALKH